MHLHRNTLKRAIDGTRTRDFNLGKVALYQLSYYRNMFCKGKDYVLNKSNKLVK